MRHTLWTGISETNVNFITSATRIHAFNNNNSYMYMKYSTLAEVYVCDERRSERLLHVFQRLIDPVEGPDERFVN